MSLKESVSAEIRAELARQAKTKKSIAELLKVSDSHAGKLINGVRPFDLEQIEIVANYLGISINQLFPDSLKGVER